MLRAKANRKGRAVLVEIELNVTGRDKVKLNRQPVRRGEDLFGTLVATVFSPDDIEIVKGGPQARRDYLDDLLAALHAKHGAARAELERVLKQRNALLRSANGTLHQAMAGALDVWDTKLAAVGEGIALARASLVTSLQPEVGSAYCQLSAAAPGVVALRYEQSWQGPLLAALQRARSEEVRRGVTTVGPRPRRHVLARCRFGGQSAGFTGGTKEPCPGVAARRPLVGGCPPGFEPCSATG